MRGALVDLRLVVAHPEYFGGGKACERRVRHQLNQTLGAGLGGYPVTLRLAALVAPDETRAQHGASIVKQHDTVHLAGETDGGNIGTLELRVREGAANGGDTRLPPILRILLR